MRIGIDIDDTISSTHFVLMKYAYKYNLEYGNKPLLKYNTNDFSQVFGWNPEEVNSYFRTYYLTALQEIEPKYGAREALTMLRKMGHEIVFITIRNDRECNGENEARRLTEEWLKKYGIPYDELHVDIHDKKEFCREHGIDVFMDDSVKNVLAVNELGIKTFIAMNVFNLDFENEQISKIYNLEQFVREIIRLERNSNRNNSEAPDNSGDDRSDR